MFESLLTALLLALLLAILWRVLVKVAPDGGGRGRRSFEILDDFFRDRDAPREPYLPRDAPDDGDVGPGKPP